MAVASRKLTSIWCIHCPSQKYIGGGKRTLRQVQYSKAFHNLHSTPNISIKGPSQIGNNLNTKLIDILSILQTTISTLDKDRAYWSTQDHPPSLRPSPTIMTAFQHQHIIITHHRRTMAHPTISTNSSTHPIAFPSSM